MSRRKQTVPVKAKDRLGESESEAQQQSELCNGNLLSKEQQAQGDKHYAGEVEESTGNCSDALGCVSVPHDSAYESRAELENSSVGTNCDKMAIKREFEDGHMLEQCEFDMTNTDSPISRAIDHVTERIWYCSDDEQVCGGKNQYSYRPRLTPLIDCKKCTSAEQAKRRRIDTAPRRQIPNSAVDHRILHKTSILSRCSNLQRLNNQSPRTPCLIVHSPQERDPTAESALAVFTQDNHTKTIEDLPFRNAILLPCAIIDDDHRTELDNGSVQIIGAAQMLIPVAVTRSIFEQFCTKPLFVELPSQDSVRALNEAILPVQVRPQQAQNSITHSRPGSEESTIVHNFSKQRSWTSATSKAFPEPLANKSEGDRALQESSFEQTVDANVLVLSGGSRHGHVLDRGCSGVPLNGEPQASPSDNAETCVGAGILSSASTFGCTSHVIASLPDVLHPADQTSSSANVSANQLVERRYPCPACDIRFSSPVTLDAHRAFYCKKSQHGYLQNKTKSCSPGPKPTGDIHETFTEFTERYADDDDYACSACDCSFSSSSQFSLHLKTEHGLVKVFVCGACGYKGYSLRGTKAHLKTHKEFRGLIDYNSDASVRSSGVLTERIEPLNPPEPDLPERGPADPNNPNKIRRRRRRRTKFQMQQSLASRNQSVLPAPKSQTAPNNSDSKVDHDGPDSTSGAIQATPHIQQSSSEPGGQQLLRKSPKRNITRAKRVAKTTVMGSYHFSEISAKDGSARFRCNYCAYVSKYKGNIKRHLCVVHNQ